MKDFDEARFQRALAFATRAHGDQKSGDGTPYILHPERVARMIAALESSTMEMVETAVLHDVDEDTEVTSAEIRSVFLDVVADYVALLTDPPLSFGNRPKRKAEVCRKMLYAPWQVKTVKLGDIIDNMRRIESHGVPNFAAVFFREKDVLLDNLLGGNQELWSLARATCDAGLRKYELTE